MIYTKNIGGRQVFGDCSTIQLEYDHPPLRRGQFVSNPDSQLIYDEDWREYVPPVVPQTEPSSDEIISAVKRMLANSTESLTDEEALEVAALFPTWISKIGEQVNVNERYWYNEKLYKVIQQHTVQENWTPDTAVSLFVEVSIEEWPELVVPIPSTNPYMKGDKVTYKGKHYICLMDNVVWTPDEYGAAWEEV